MNSNITVRQLRAFLMVAQEQSFTKAAEHLNNTQSALTAAVKSLESEIGLKLFDRTTRVVIPTVHGEQFATVAERLLADLQGAVDDLRAIAERRQGHVTVGATATMINHVLIPAISELSQTFPGIRVRLVEELTTGAISRVASGELDIALTTIDAPDAGIEVIPLMRDRFKLVCLPDHPLAAKQKALPWQSLNEAQRIALSGQSGIRDQLSRDDVGQIAVQSLMYEVSSVSGLVKMVEQGLGVAAVPALISTEMADRGIVSRPLTPARWRTVSLAFRQGRSPTPATATLIDAALSRLAAIETDDIVPLVNRKTLEDQGLVLA